MKNVNIRNVSIKAKIEAVMAFILLSVFYFVASHMDQTVMGNAQQKEQYQKEQGQKEQDQKEQSPKGKMIVVDPGHGGRDGGKQSTDGTLEKDINLEISKILKGKLEEQGFKVILTRDTDTGLYRETDSNKKTSDLKKRCQIINESGAVCAVSIHQNSYTGQSVKGAQVFYYQKSEDAKELAESIQQALISNVDPSNKRRAKNNTSYYMLLHTECPSVIVECGFLSNPEEAALLKTKEYQEKIADAVCKGIIYAGDKW